MTDTPHATAPVKAQTPEETKARADARKAQIADAEAVVDARLAAKEKQVKENAEREANSQPTPTQRENDLARLGALTDDKEDDGSPPQLESVQRVVMERLDNPYTARDDMKKSPPKK